MDSLTDSLKLVKDVKINEEKYTTNESDDSDIIESTFEKEKEKPKCNVLNSNTKIWSNVEQSYTKSLNSSSTKKCIRLSLKNNYNLVDVTPVSKEKNNSFKTLDKSPISSKCLEKNSALKKIMSSIKKKSDSNTYLSRTKLQNIEYWLRDNNVETVKTPPFANLSATSPNLKKNEMFKSKQKRLLESLSINSDIKDVLKAVYGHNWMKDNLQKKFKTEPRKKLSFLKSPKSVSSNVFPSSRRNIFKSDENNLTDCSLNESCAFDDSFMSGIDIINLDDSRNHLDNNKESTTKTELKDKNNKSSVIRKVRPKGQTSNLQEKKKSCSNNSPKAISVQSSAPKHKKKTFLASLSFCAPSPCHPDAECYKTNFKSKKENLTKKLYSLYNNEVFENKLPNDMNFSWNVKLRGTAGYCYNKRITKSTGEVVRQSRIEFSTKIVDRPGRLRDTMIHELCHAASWVIDGILDGHGMVWQSWAVKAMKRFPELPKIKRCHNYDIISKYVYRCISCGYSVKRHSKSINTEKKRCGHCYGNLELLLNKGKKGKAEAPDFNLTRTLRTPNKFALFVKENYHSIKNKNKNANHAQIMKILSENYAMMKANSKP